MSEIVQGETNCCTCGNSWAWHLQHPEVRHPFNDGSVPFKTTFGDRGRHDDQKRAQRGSEDASRPAMPFDPVLRQALIDKGVLTPDDLRDAEAKIMVITGQFQDSVRKVMKEDGEGEVQI